MEEILDHIEEHFAQAWANSPDVTKWLEENPIEEESACECHI